ncbi:hypothetical protein HMPREF1569_1371 [Klebsiella oxytoca OK-1]|nr:hypothetical protein HMPREF1569_1371 [Klebsiella oxytoca OK-1]
MIIKVPAINFYIDQSFRKAVILFPVVERFFNCQRFYFSVSPAPFAVSDPVLPSTTP